MEQITNRDITNRAAVNGLILGAVSGSFVFINFVLASSVAGTLLSWVLWLGKLIGCILLMKWFMTKLVSEFSGVTNSDTRRLGNLTALFSAILTAVCYYVAVDFVFPDAIAQAQEVMMEQMSGMLDDNTRAMMDNITGKMGTIQFFFQLIWCYLYGVILSAILSARIPTPDPFANFKDNTDEQ